MTTALLPAPRRTTQPPPAWMVLLAQLGCGPRLARELWHAFGEVFPERVTLLHFELERLCTPAPETIWEQRAAHVAQLLAPRDLLHVSARLAPEGQGRRRADVREFEEVLLTKVDSAGRWR